MQTLGVGLGLRPEHYQEIQQTRPDIPWFEVISENYLYTRGRPFAILQTIRSEYPLALHGVSLSIGAERQDRLGYLVALKNLTEAIDPWIISDHLCWTGIKAANMFDLLPLPFTMEAVELVSRNLDQVQSFLKKRLYLENISAYFSYRRSEMSECDFLLEVVAKSGCGILLDINNLYVNSQNFDFNPKEYINRLSPEVVGQLHLGGHTDTGEFLFDSHDQPVCEPVWELYAYALSRLGKIPTLIEWDARIPEFKRLKQEQERASAIYCTTYAKRHPGSNHHLHSESRSQ